MPGLGTSAFSNLESVLNRARAIINDSEVAGGDVLTDSYAALYSLCNVAYENIQRRLASAGVETFSGYAWLLSIPAIGTGDPEARIIINDGGTLLIYPSGTGNANYNNPRLPIDMIVPLKLWERQNGTSGYVSEMKQPNDGLLQNFTQQNALIDWEWGSYGSDAALMFRGALQAQDVKVKYERRLANLAATTDPVPIRGVDNAAAYEIAKVFAAGRGSTVAAAFGKEGDDEIEQLINISARRAQRKHSRRRPYSGRGGRQNQYL